MVAQPGEDAANIRCTGGGVGGVQPRCLHQELCAEHLCIAAAVVIHSGCNALAVAELRCLIGSSNIERAFAHGKKPLWLNSSSIVSNIDNPTASGFGLVLLGHRVVSTCHTQKLLENLIHISIGGG